MMGSLAHLHAGWAKAHRKTLGSGAPGPDGSTPIYRRENSPSSPEHQGSEHSAGATDHITAVLHKCQSGEKAGTPAGWPLLLTPRHWHTAGTRSNKGELKRQAWSGLSDILCQEARRGLPWEEQPWPPGSPQAGQRGGTADMVLLKWCLSPELPYR